MFFTAILLPFQMVEGQGYNPSNKSEISFDRKTTLLEHFRKDNATYELSSVLDLYGDTLVIAENSILVFKRRGQIRNGHVIFKNTTIESKDKTIFRNITAVGTLTNRTIIVKWFDCSPNTKPEENFRTLKYAVLPVAIKSGADVYHSEKGTYRILGQYPIYESSWKKDHSYIRDFNNITIYGKGYKTIIKATRYKDELNPGDVFNMIDLKNLHVRDLGITSEAALSGNAPHGTNGVSLVESIENVSVSNCRIFDLPSNYRSTEVTVDGGHGITIQAADSNTIQRNIRIYNNLIENVSLGLEYSKGSLGRKGVVDNVVFEKNTIVSSYVGFYSHGYHEDVSKSSLVIGNIFKNCQYGIYGYAMQGFTFRRNTIQTTKRTIKDTKISNGVYGILLYGPKDIVLENNVVELRNADSFLLIDVVSENPRYNGFIEDVHIINNSYKGNAKNKYLIRNDTKYAHKLCIEDNVININEIKDDTNEE